MTRCVVLLCILVALPLQAAEAPALRDFAWRQPLTAETGLPIQELALPDTVYQNILHADLSDLRVFNAGGGVVPHALCPAPAVKQVEPAPVTLKPFPLRGGVKPVIGEGGRIAISTADGTNVLITQQGGIASATPPQPAVPDQAAAQLSEQPVAYIFDLRAMNQPVRAISLNWRSTNQASEASISLKTSEDLSQWLTLIPNATLLSAQSGNESLQRARIPLPEREYRFLRIEAGALGPLPAIDSIVAERIAAPDPVPPIWVEAKAVSADPADSAIAFTFSAERRAPVHSAEVRLPAANMALGVLLQSRDDAAQTWRRRWQGEVFALAVESATRGQTVVQFEPTADRYWRLEVQRGGETLRNLSPSLMLAYRPARLRFLAQGEGPYQLAYGSARVERQRPGCDSLLAGLSAEERTRMSGQAEASGAPLRSNLDALEPPPERTPLRQIVLWGVLIAGTLLVAGMAFSLLKKLRQE